MLPEFIVKLCPATALRDKICRGFCAELRNTGSFRQANIMKSTIDDQYDLKSDYDIGYWRLIICN